MSISDWEVLFALAVTLILLATPVIAVRAWLLVRRQRTDLAALRTLLFDLDRRLLEVQRSLTARDAPEPTGGNEMIEPQEQPSPAPVPPPPPASRPRAVFSPSPRLSASPPPAQTSLEEKLTSRWLVWVGGLALALSGIFLVKYSIENGLLGPWTRMAAGCVSGAALTVAGEWLRRRPRQRAFAALGPDHVPAALSSAGVVTLFGSIYSGYAVHDLLAPLTAFVLLAAVALGAVALSLLQGWFVAVLGLVGAYAVPLLVATGQPLAAGLFPYLGVVTAAGLTVGWLRPWGWLGWPCLVGALGWVWLWFIDSFQSGDTPVLALYLPVVAGLFVATRSRTPEIDRTANPFRPWALPGPVRLVLMAGALVAFTVLVLLLADRHGAWSVTALVLLALGSWVAARREPVLDLLPIMAATATVLGLTLWNIPELMLMLEAWTEHDGPYAELRHSPVLPDELLGFAWTCFGFTVLWGVGGGLLLRGAARPGLWASLSSAMPLLMLVVSYLHIAGFGTSFGWALVALGVGVVQVLTAATIRRDGRPELWRGAVGAYAVGTVAALALAATMALEEAWLTVTLAVLLPAMAWIGARLELPALRRAGWVLAGVVVGRILADADMLEDGAGGPPILNWILYGYGVPALAFLAAARQFRRTADDALVSVLEAGALVFAVLLVSLEIRHWVEDGAVLSGRYGLLEQSLQSMAWLAMAWGLYRRERTSSRRVIVWGARLLGGLATAQVLLLQVLLFNPLFSGESVWEPLGVNLLLLAYGVPALFALLIRREAARRGHDLVAKSAGLAALGLILVEITLEVRHGFHGPHLALGTTGDAEWWAYSVAWLVYAGVLLAVGLVTGGGPVRWASLTLVLGTVAKVFLFDMSELTGLYRVGSFFGLGVALVGIAMLYQRLVFRRTRR